MPDKKKQTGFSLAPSAQVDSGGIGLGPGRAKAIKHKFGLLRYTGKREGLKATALMVTFLRGGEKTVEAYTVGKSWKPTEDGKFMTGGDGTGLNKSSKAALYFKSLEDHAQMPKDWLSNDVSVLDGVDVELIRKPMEKGEGMTGDPTVLIVDDVYSAPWKIKGGKKEVAADSDDQEVGSGDDEDEDEDEDEDDKPKGKKKPAADDDDDDQEEDADEDQDEDIDELAGEALIDALDDGPLKASKIQAAVLDKVKKHKQAKQIAARAADPKFLKGEKGWSWDGKQANKD